MDAQEQAFQVHVVTGPPGKYKIDRVIESGRSNCVILPIWFFPFSISGSGICECWVLAWPLMIPSAPALWDWWTPFLLLTWPSTHGCQGLLPWFWHPAWSAAACDLMMAPWGPDYALGPEKNIAPGPLDPTLPFSEEDVGSHYPRTPGLDFCIRCLDGTPKSEVTLFQACPQTCFSKKRQMHSFDNLNNRLY